MTSTNQLDDFKTSTTTKDIKYLNEEDKSKLRSICFNLEIEDDSINFILPVEYNQSKDMMDDYYSIITEPMDILTIKKRLHENSYSNIAECYYDFDLIWKNCMSFNKSDSYLYKSAQNMKIKFEAEFKKLFPEEYIHIQRLLHKKRSAETNLRDYIKIIDIKKYFSSGDEQIIEKGVIYLQKNSPQAIENTAKGVMIKYDSMSNKEIVNLHSYLETIYNDEHKNISINTELHLKEKILKENGEVTGINIDSMDIKEANYSQIAKKKREPQKTNTYKEKLKRKNDNTNVDYSSDDSIVNKSNQKKKLNRKNKVNKH